MRRIGRDPSFLIIKFEIKIKKRKFKKETFFFLRQIIIRS